MKLVVFSDCSAQDLGDGSRERGLPMVHVTDGADVDVGLVSNEPLLGHVLSSTPPSVFDSCVLEPTAGVEPATPFLPRTCSASELCGPDTCRAVPIPRVEGVGFEPTKPVGRQIYSLVRLAAPPPLRAGCAYQCSIGPVGLQLPGTLRRRPRRSGAVMTSRYASRRVGTARQAIWSPRGDSNPPTCRLQIGCATIAPLGRTTHGDGRAQAPRTGRTIRTGLTV